MVSRTEQALKVAEFLLQIKAVELNPENPNTWAPGLKSPIYCDIHKILSYPKIRTYIRQQFAELIEDHYGKPEIIAGISAGGIAFGALVAEEMGLPFIFIRNEAKKQGTGNLIGGVCEKGQRIVAIEDLISTGKSSISAIKSLREAGAQVSGLVAAFSYGLSSATEIFKEAGCRLLALSDYDTLLQQALTNESLTETQYTVLREWKTDPEKWLSATESQNA